ncbi:unnamed protein product [Pneumocystis jirovecii]|uniref:GOLD domain-containing protein n=1 Tax=Pneumocystis jirovecii TaxID=42068 RepID=L0PEU2_PNEJI|nr:unnamed protein product [Pneumocystis jirovecii]
MHREQQTWLSGDQKIYILSRKQESEEHGIGQFGYKSSQFMFTADQTAEHQLCFEIHSRYRDEYRVRVTLDLVMGDAKTYDNKATESLDNMTHRAKDLNQQIYEIRLAQKMMRV